MGEFLFFSPEIQIDLAADSDANPPTAGYGQGMMLYLQPTAKSSFLIESRYGKC
jgi:hypothetical protein